MSKAIERSNSIKKDRNKLLLDVSSSEYHNYLWSIFRSSAQKIMINSVLQGVTSESLIDYSTYYSETLN